MTKDRVTFLLHKYIGALAVYCAITLTVLDGTLMNVALPSFSSIFHADESATIWIVNCYQLVITMFLMSFAALGDKWGYRKVFLLGVIVFTLSSAACAMCHNLTSLVVCRGIQGVGASCIMSVNPALLRTIYPEKHLGRGLGINAMVVAVSTVVGPTLAGTMLAVLSWHWLFLINVPVGIAAYLIGKKHLPENPAKGADEPFDKVSAIECALIFGLFVNGMDAITVGTEMTRSIVQILIALIIAVFFVRRQHGRKAPLLPVDLFKIPVFSLSLCTSISSFCAQMIAMVSLPFLLQNVMGFDVLKIGLLMAPWALGTMVCANIAGRLCEKINGGLLGFIGMSIFAAGLLILYFMPTDASEWSVVWRMLICGCGFGTFQTPNNVIIMTSAPKHRSGAASGMQGTARVLGQTIGTTIVSAMFAVCESGTTARTCLAVAAAIAVVASMISFLRRNARTSAV